MQYFFTFWYSRTRFYTASGDYVPQTLQRGGGLYPLHPCWRHSPQTPSPPLLHGLLDPPLSLAADARCLVGDVSLC